VSTHARQLGHDLWRDGNGWILLSIATGWFLSIGVRVVYPAILPFIRDEFGISLTIAGLLLTVVWSAYALGQLPGGLLGDWYGEGNILVVSTLLSSGAIIIVASSQTIETLFLASMIFGFSTALYGPIRFTVFTDVYTDRAATAVGLTMAAGNVGNSVLPVLAVFLAGIGTWRWGFWITAPMFFGVCLFLKWSVPARTAESTALLELAPRMMVKRVAGAIRQRDILAFTLVQVFMGFTFQGFIGFYPTYLIEVKELAPTTAASVFGVFFLSAIVLQPLAGIIQDAVGAKRTLSVAIGLFIIGLVVLPVLSGTIVLVLVTIVLAARTGNGVIVNTYLAEALPADVKGSGLGLLRTVWILIGTTGPTVIGIFGDQGLLQEAFYLLAVLAMIALIIVYFTPVNDNH
jgi:MFS family permease